MEPWDIREQILKKGTCNVTKLGRELDGGTWNGCEEGGPANIMMEAPSENSFVASRPSHKCMLLEHFLNTKFRRNYEQF